MRQVVEFTYSGKMKYVQMDDQCQRMDNDGI